MGRVNLTARIFNDGVDDHHLILVEDRIGERTHRATAYVHGRPKSMIVKIEPVGLGKITSNELSLSRDFEYLAEGDIIRFDGGSNWLRVLYRRNSRHNFLFLTERCNSHCLMCSQPPRAVNDDHLVDEILQTIPLMSKDTLELGITGGEPTLLGTRLLNVISCVKEHLPTTSLHMLSNGRLFEYLQYAKKIAEIGHSDFMIGIPLYADISGIHDFVVQSHNAFNQTIHGILNLARVGVKIEIRMVIHRETYSRLSQFAHYIVRNLPFADQVVFMGLELMGFARTNVDALWIDPVEYQNELESAFEILTDARVPCYIYNHQLCLLKPSLHQFAKCSISDWKNEYHEECEVCVVREKCGGFFASGKLRVSKHIKAFTHLEPHLHTLA